MAEGATHVAHCNDVHSDLRGWSNAFTHVAHCPNKRLFGFTLAEVLITLGIIGVVVAVTLPTLIQKYQKKTYIEGLKVGVSILEQGFKVAMADDGVDNLPDT